MTVIDDGSDQRCTGISMPAFESQAVSEMTYTVSRGTLNPSIPYHTVSRGTLNPSIPYHTVSSGTLNSTIPYYRVTGLFECSL